MANLLNPDQLSGALDLEVSSVLGSTLTTFCIGGKLNLIEINSNEELRRIITFLFQHDQKFRVMGAGSNLLIPDAGLDEWVLKLGKGFRNFSRRSSSIFEIGGNYPLMTLARELSQEGLSGLEFAAGIPGSLGGAVWMNAGAHRGEIGTLIEEIHGITESGQEFVFLKKDLELSYRKTNLPKGIIVTAAVIRLVPGDKEKTSAHMRECLAYRKATQPLQLPSAGSVFRNPEEQNPAGSILDKAGVKGLSVGGAQVSELHANWIVNSGRQAKAKDVQDLIAQCQERVFKQFQLQLIPEIVIW